MRRSLADAILKAYAEYAKPNLPDGLPDSHNVPLLVQFKLGDLRSLERGINSIDEALPRTKSA